MLTYKTPFETSKSFNKLTSNSASLSLHSNSLGPSPLQCESNRIQNRFEPIRINPDQSGLGRFYTSLSLIETTPFRDIIHRYRHVTIAPRPQYSCGNDGLCTTSGAVLLATVSFRQKVEKGDVAKRSRGRKSKMKQNTEKALSTVCTYWLFRLDPLIACCIRSSPQTVSNVQLSSLFHSAPAIPDIRYT